MKLLLRTKKNELPLFVFLAVMLVWVCFIAGDFAKADGADLHSFLYDEVSFSVIGYEPIFSFLQLFFQVFSIHSALDFIPSLIVAASVCIHIVRSMQPVLLKCFWAACLIFPLSLQNFRVGSLFLLMLFIPVSPKFYGMFVHWSYVVLVASNLMRVRQLFVFGLIFFVSFLVFQDYLILAASKLNYYIEQDFSSAWGAAVFFEWIFLSLIYFQIYKKSSVSISAQVLILGVSFICQLLTLYVVASRLNLLSVGVSLIELRDRKIIKIPSVYIGLMGVVAFYECLRFLANIPDTNFYAVFH